MNIEYNDSETVALGDWIETNHVARKLESANDDPVASEVVNDRRAGPCEL